MSRDRLLLALMGVYAVASLVHFVHNAVYIDEYPNLPAWLTPVGVYAAWLVVVAVGVVGYWALRNVSTIAGLVVIGIYAALGFGGLDHYAVAPVSAHSTAMNLTILAEVVAASLLLVAVVWRVMTRPPVR